MFVMFLINCLGSVLPEDNNLEKEDSQESNLIDEVENDPRLAVRRRDILKEKAKKKEGKLLKDRVIEHMKFLHIHGCFEYFKDLLSKDYESTAAFLSLLINGEGTKHILIEEELGDDPIIIDNNLGEDFIVEIPIIKSMANEEKVNRLLIACCHELLKTFGTELKDGERIPIILERHLIKLKEHLTSIEKDLLINRCEEATDEEGNPFIDAYKVNLMKSLLGAFDLQFIANKELVKLLKTKTNDPEFIDNNFYLIKETTKYMKENKDLVSPLFDIFVEILTNSECKCDLLEKKILINNLQTSTNSGENFYKLISKIIDLDQTGDVALLIDYLIGKMNPKEKVYLLEAIASSKASYKAEKVSLIIEEVIDLDFYYHKKTYNHVLKCFSSDLTKIEELTRRGFLNGATEIDGNASFEVIKFIADNIDQDSRIHLFADLVGSKEIQMEVLLEGVNYIIDQGITRENIEDLDISYQEYMITGLLEREEQNEELLILLLERDLITIRDIIRFIDDVEKITFDTMKFLVDRIGINNSLRLLASMSINSSISVLIKKEILDYVTTSKNIKHLIKQAKFTKMSQMLLKRLLWNLAKTSKEVPNNTELISYLLENNLIRRISSRDQIFSRYNPNYEVLVILIDKIIENVSIEEGELTEEANKALKVAEIINSLAKNSNLDKETFLKIEEYLKAI